MKKLKTAFISLLCLSCMTISNKGSASNPVLRISDGWVADTIAPALIHYRFAGYDSISQAHQNVDVLEVDLTSPSYDIQLVYEEHGSTKASEEKGRTMPEVPMMEMPSTIPSLGLKVRCANSFPPGTEMVTSSPLS